MANCLFSVSPSSYDDSNESKEDSYKVREFSLLCIFGAGCLEAVWRFMLMLVVGVIVDGEAVFI